MKIFDDHGLERCVANAGDIVEVCGINGIPQCTEKMIGFENDA